MDQRLQPSFAIEAQISETVSECPGSDAGSASAFRALHSFSPAIERKYLTDIPAPPSVIHVATAGEADSFSFARIFGVENLVNVYQKLRRSGGHTPGSDGIGFDMSRSECYKVFRSVSRAIAGREYSPAPARVEMIRKPGGGHRRIEIPTIVDRVVGAAFCEAIRGLMVNRLPRYFGAAASPLAILGKIFVLATDRGWYHLAVDDIRNCFPSLPKALVLDSFWRAAERWGIPLEQLETIGVRWLIQKLINGHDDGETPIGISQGSTFSLSPPQ